MARSGLDPTSRRDREELAKREVEKPLADLQAMRIFHDKTGTWAVSVDNVPRKLLTGGGGGVVQAVVKAN